MNQRYSALLATARRYAALYPNYFGQTCHVFPVDIGVLERGLSTNFLHRKQMDCFSDYKRIPNKMWNCQSRLIIPFRTFCRNLCSLWGTTTTVCKPV